MPSLILRSILIKFAFSCVFGFVFFLLSSKNDASKFYRTPFWWYLHQHPIFAIFVSRPTPYLFRNNMLISAVQPTMIKNKL
ncbi:unnamed protein product, partial [Tenebrio molitor]